MGKNVFTAHNYQDIIFISFMHSLHEMNNWEIEYLALRKHNGFKELKKFVSRTKLPKYEEVRNMYIPIFTTAMPQHFPLLHSVQTCTGAHKASYPVSTGVDFHGSKAAEARS
jgi:hypothetical protein